jgi:ATP-dependent RNA helicase DHX8/PRP22
VQQAGALGIIKLCPVLLCRALRKAQDIYAQLEGHLASLGLPIKSCGSDYVPVQRALVAGLFPHAAKRQPDRTYRWAEGCD